MDAEPDARDRDQRREHEQRPAQRGWTSPTANAAANAVAACVEGIEPVCGTATSGWTAGSTSDGRGRSNHLFISQREALGGEVRDRRQPDAEREPAPPQVGDEADPDDHEALHPPVGEVDEDRVRRAPVQALEAPRRRSGPSGRSHPIVSADRVYRGALAARRLTCPSSATHSPREEHRPATSSRNAVRAEECGFSFALISDHFHPWVDAQGESPFVWSVIGAIAQATERLRLGTGVTCPTIRIHPGIIAQAAATSAALMEGRFFLGVGTGENLNEHIFGA